MRRYVVPIIVAVVAIAGAVWAGTVVGNALRAKSVNSQLKAPPLVFADEDLVIDPIPESEQIERELRITNPSSEVRTISRFEFSCSCFGVEPAGNIVFQPGETKTFRIKLKGTIPDGAAVSRDGLFHEMIDLAAVLPGANGDRPQRVATSVRYTVKQTVQFEPTSARLGVVSHREQVRVKAVVTLRPPITDVRVVPNPEWDVRIVQTRKDQRELTAELARPGVARSLSETIQLIPVCGDGAERPPRPFRITGEIRSDVVSTPAQIPLGRVKCVSVVEESFRLSSLSNRPFRVVKAESESPDVSVAVDDTDQKSFVARVTVKGSGEQVRQVVVMVKQDDESELTVRVHVHYFGE